MLTRTAAVAAVSAYQDLDTFRPAVIDGLTVTENVTPERVVYTVENADGERLIVGTRERMYRACNGWRINAGLSPEVPV